MTRACSSLDLCGAMLPGMNNKQRRESYRGQEDDSESWFEPGLLADGAKSCRAASILSQTLGSEHSEPLSEGRRGISLRQIFQQIQQRIHTRDLFSFRSL